MSKFIRRLPIVLLAAFLAFTLWGTESAEAATIATCSIYQNNQLNANSQSEALDCATTIAAEADQIEDVAYGKWGRNWLAIEADGSAHYSRGRGWIFWQTLELAQPEPIVGDIDRDGILDEVDQCVDSAENFNNIFDTDGCPDDLYDLLNFANDDLNVFWADEFAEANITYREPSRVQTYTSGGRYSRNYNAYYAPYSHSIHLDTRLLTDSLNSLGDVAPIFILAHEYGHLVQSQLGLLGRGRATIDSELEADCLAGSYLQNLDERGLLESGDVEEAMWQAYSVGDNLPAEHDHAHGSPTQRANAFSLGFENGADTCLQSF